MRILVSGPSLRDNLGGPSIFHGLVRVLVHCFPDCEIVFHESGKRQPNTGDPEPVYPNVSYLYASPRAREIIMGAVSKRYFGTYRGVGSSAIELLEALRTSDLFIESMGIAFADNLYRVGVKGVLACEPLIRAASLFGVRAVHYTASYGPMQHRSTKLAVRFVLGRLCSLVYCREERSMQYLRECGLSADKLVAAPDTGILMPCVRISIEGVDGSSPLVGVSVSSQLARQWGSRDEYLAIIAEICDRAVTHYGAQILLIPNEVGPGERGDHAVARDVKDRVAEKSRVLILEAERYSSPQMKSAISQCELLIASRYHSVVAAMSTGVPTVVLGWHHKYEELLARFNQRAVALSWQNCTVDALWGLCQDVWVKRDQVKATILQCLPGVEKDIYQAAGRLKDIFRADS